MSTRPLGFSASFMRLIIINPNSSQSSYQGLSLVYSAIEPPTWALLLAESCRKHTSAEVLLLDCDAERLTNEESVIRITEAKPDLILFVVYGQNPNSGTVNMAGALSLAAQLKEAGTSGLIAFVGSHISALPLEVLADRSVDIVLVNEGVYALRNLLHSNLSSDLAQIRGIGYKSRDTSGEVLLKLNAPERVVPQDSLDVDLPGYAWDLLPYKERPLDLYRSHFWHAHFDHSKRTPFAAIYTSLGCNFGCDFCMINIVNRNDHSPGVSAADSKGMRFWSVDWVIRQIRILASMGVRTLRLSDEMFFLNKKYYGPILEQIVHENFDLNMWAYARVDSVREGQLDLFHRAGVSWLALGIETGNQNVRREVSKGSYKDVNVREICSGIRGSGLNVIANYIFGLPDDDLTTMQETLDLALELNTETANMYPCQALPGSPVYFRAKSLGWKLPDSFSGYGFLSYDCQPLRTKHLSAQEVLRFRDNAWQQYFTNPGYLRLVETKFGAKQRQNVEEMARVPLKRKILGH